MKHTHHIASCIKILQLMNITRLIALVLCLTTVVLVTGLNLFQLFFIVAVKFTSAYMVLMRTYQNP